jgi:hypothetical protein
MSMVFRTPLAGNAGLEGWKGAWLENGKVRPA